MCTVAPVASVFPYLKATDLSKGLYSGGQEHKKISSIQRLS